MVLTGVRPQIAQTLVQLGVDMGNVRTMSRLSDGIEFALTLIGREITTKSTGAA
jgi:rsbT co-antagonist protein RsbR